MESFSVNETIYSNDPELMREQSLECAVPTNSNSSVISLHNESFNSNVSLNLNDKVQEIIEIFDGNSSLESNNESTVLEKNDVEDGVLRGVNVYVEVRSGNENRSKSIESQLKKLGANIFPKFTNEVTHVVFRDGRKITVDKAKKRNVKLVSVLWVESCRLSQTRVPEDQFPAQITRMRKPKSSPFLINSKDKSAKKFRCMQPRDFEMQFSNSTKKVQSILDRLRTDLPNIMSLNKEIPKKKLFSSNSVPMEMEKSPIFTPKNTLQISEKCLSVDSYKVKNELSLKQKLLDIQYSLNALTTKCGVNDENNVNSINSNTCQTLPSKLYYNAAKTDINSNVKKSLNYKPEILKIHEPESTSKANHLSKNMETKSLSKKLDESFNDDHNISGISLLTDNESSNLVIGENMTETSKEDKTEIETGTEPDARKSRKFDVMDVELFDRLIAGESGNSSEKSKNSHLESILKPSSCAPLKAHLIKDLNCDNSDSSPEILGYILGKTQGISSSKKISRVFKKVNDENLITPSKRSCDKYTNDNIKKKRKILENSKITNCSYLNENSSNSEKLNKILKPRQSIFEFKPLQSAENFGKRRSHSRSTKLSSIKDFALPSIVATSLKPEDRHLIKSAVKLLGGFSFSKDVTKNTTHVICGDKRRTLSIMKAIANGCWILSIDWILKSLSENKWICEKSFELEHYFPAIKISRENKQKCNGNYSPDIFSSVGPIFIASNASLSQSELQNLIINCQGQVTGCHRKAALAVGRFFKEVTSVSDKWIFDCIVEHTIMPYCDYPLSMST